MERVTPLPFTIGRKPDDWREKIREATRVMINSLIDRDGPGHAAAIREEVVLAARVALGEAESGPLVGAMLENADAIDDGIGFEEGSMPGMFRYVLDTFHRVWDTPTQHESIMAEVTTALDEKFGARRIPAEWREKIDKLARMMATLEHHLADPGAKGDRAGMLSRVIGHLDVALSDAPTGPMFDRMTITRADGTVGEEEMASLPGTIRLVIAGFDVSDPGVVATIRGIIERGARDELTKEVPGQLP